MKFPEEEIKEKFERGEISFEDAQKQLLKIRGGLMEDSWERNKHKIVGLKNTNLEKNEQEGKNEK